VKRLFDLAEPVEAVEPDVTGSVIYDRFQEDLDLLNIPVVDGARRPVGLIERTAFTLKMAGQYGRSLYAGRPVALLMDAEPRVVDGDTSVQVFAEESLSLRPKDLLGGFIVTRDGRYVGVGSALSLLQVQNAIIRHHAAEAQAALRAKSEFLGVMSHELRTPLNGVLAVAEVVDRRLEQETLRPFVRTIINSGETLLRLLNDALDLSRAETGRLELIEEPFRAGGLAEDVDALWRPRAGDNGVALVTAFEGDADLRILGDAVRIKQILNNFISNALKFTPGGVVDVRLTARVDDIHVRLRGEVRDSGCGIDPEHLADIFEPFSQTAAGKQAGGAGLGLSICRHLAEKMGGHVAVASQPGQGSTFSFEVPLYRVAAPVEGVVEPPAPAWERGGTHVLIADDNATNRLVAETLCQMFDCTCESAENGAEAVALASTGRFDLVLMDIKMPVMDGVEATGHIRRLAREGVIAGRLPVIALTANADPFDAESYLAQGMDAVVEKPIKPDVLMAAMSRVLGAELDAALVAA
jgi:signal transduction histidine kinase/ActR/RegA family two-component response regulator